MKPPKAKKLPSGSWFAQVMVDGRRVSITRPTEKEVLAEAMALKAGVKAAKTAPASVSVRTAIDDYIELRRAVLSPATIRGYRIIQKNRFQAIIDRPISSLTDADFQKAVNADARICSGKTMRNSWGFVSSVIRETCGREISVRLPQVIHDEKPFLQPDDIPVFIEAIRGTRSEIALLLGLHGLRASEILAIRKEDIDLPNGLILVRGAAVPDESNNLVYKKENKNSASRRAVPILIPRLRELIEQSDFRGTDYVAGTVSSGTFYNAVARACKRAGLPMVGVHGLRHSFASLCYHKNIPEAVTMKLGGWSDPGTMRKIYTHVADKDLSKQTEKLSAFFSSVKITNEITNEK